MYRIRLIHWNVEEGEERAEFLRSLGFEASHLLPQGRNFLQALRGERLDAVVVDLSRLPSQGRDLAVMIRRQKSTRQIPMVFAGGAADKVERIKALLPDAFYASWDQIGATLRKAIAHPPSDPVVPGSAFAAYAGKPLVQKLGIKADSTLGLIDAPARFEKTLGEIPEGVAVRIGEIVESDLVIWFTRSQDELVSGMRKMASGLGRGPVWIAWPKKASGVDSDLSQQFVRETGLDAGLVDYKVCSIDDTWSALLFRRRAKKTP